MSDAIQPAAAELSPLAKALEDFAPPDGMTPEERELALAEIVRSRMNVMSAQHVRGGIAKATLDALMYCTMSFALVAFAANLLHSIAPPNHLFAHRFLGGVLVLGGVAISVAACFVAIDTWDRLLRVGKRKFSTRGVLGYSFGAVALCWFCLGATFLAVIPLSPAAEAHTAPPCKPVSALSAKRSSAGLPCSCL